MPPRGARDSAAFELREALAQPGCAICSLALRSVGRFLTSLAYERVNDVQTRAELRARGGFCSVHAYRWLREAHSVLGTALIYRDVLRALVDGLESTRERGRTGWLDRLTGRDDEPGRAGACPACSAQHEAEDRYVSALLAILDDRPGMEAFARSDGVCLVHARAAVRRGGPAAQHVLARTRADVEQVIATLDEVIRKEDYRFRDEPRSEAERRAPPRAVSLARGAEGLAAEA